MGYQASPTEGDHAIHVGRFSLAPLLRLTDAVIASLQRLKHRIEVPEEEEVAEGGRKRTVRESHAEPAAVVAAPKASRLPRFAVALLVLFGVGGLGMAFSYKLLSQSLRTNEAVVEALRDEIARLEKDGTRLLNDKAKYQKQVYEREKEIRALEQEVEDYRGETEGLRSQVNAMKATRGGPLAQANPANVAVAGRRPAPQKTGTCTTGGANAAANLARCVDEFNRK